MKRILTIFILIAIVVGTLSVGAFAQPLCGGRFPHPQEWERPECPFLEAPRWMSSLSLTSEQKTKLLELEKRNAEKVTVIQSKLYQAFLTLQELSLKPTSEETANQIRATLEEIANLHQELYTLRQNMYREFLSLLTPEQLSQIAQGRPRGRGGCGPGYGLGPGKW